MGRGKNINFTQFHIAENDDGFRNSVSSLALLQREEASAI